MIQEGVLASRVGRFECNELQVASFCFFMAGLVVLRCFEFPVTEAEPRKGRELLAKRGEQKIRKNQVQAICHSLVAAWRIAGHRPRLPTHQQSLGTFLIQSLS